MAGIRVTLVDINLTVLSCVTFCTLARVLIGTISAFSSIFAGCTGTFVDVHLAEMTRKTFGTFTVKRVDLVNAFAIVEAGLAGTFICVNVTEYTLISWHTNAMKASNLIQTRCIIMAGIRHALIDIHLTAWPFVSLKTFALERAFGVQAPTTVFTRVGSKRALIDVQVAGRPSVARWAGANSLAIYWVGVTVGSLLAWVTDAGVIKMAQQTCASMRALAEEGGNTVVAGRPMIAGCAGTVIDVLAAVVARPAVHTDTVVTSMSIMAGPSILTCVGHQLAFVHIFCAVLTCVMRWTLAVVGVYSVHTDSTVLTVVAGAVINVVFTVWAGKAWQTAAVIGCVPLLDTCASVLARRGTARHVESFTVRTRILLRAPAVVGPHLVHAHAAVVTRRGQLGTFVDVLFAGFAVEGRRTRADEGGVEGRALAAVGTGVGGTGVGDVAHFTRPAWWTAASVRRKGDEVARSSIATWRAHAGVVGGRQAKAVGESQSTNAAEIEGVTVRNWTAFTAISARRRAAGTRVLAPVAYVVTGTPAFSISI